MIQNNLPKISCLLVTAAGRLNYFERSVKCYQEQTYPNRELIIVNEGPPEYQQALAERVRNIPHVRCIFLNGQYTLGALRNIAIGASFGDLWVQWDDDDFNLPQRLSVQCRHLLQYPEAKVCFLADQLHYYFPTRQLFWNDWWELFPDKRMGVIPGTILAYRQDFPFRYPSSGQWARRGEDSVLVGEVYYHESALITVLRGMGHMHVYSYHGSNVWEAEHHLKIEVARGCSRQVMLSRREEISNTLQYMRFAPSVHVMGKDGLAFVWNDVDQ